MQIWNDSVYKLTYQGDFSNLLISEKEKVTWQSFINDVPKGVLLFAINVSCVGLPMPYHLKCWGKRKVSKCPYWKSTGTLHHILSFYNVALNQGRFTWPYNSVLSHVINVLKHSTKNDTVDISSDLPN